MLVFFCYGPVQSKSRAAACGEPRNKVISRRNAGQSRIGVNQVYCWLVRRLSDAITSAFAFCGISVALIGGPGWEAADDWAALCAALIIIANALKQAKPALWELTDSVPEDPTLEARIRGISASQPGVIGLDKCHVRKMGLSYYVDLHIIVNGLISVREGHGIAHAVVDRVLRALPLVSEVLVHVGPEEELSSRADANARNDAVRLMATQRERRTMRVLILSLALGVFCSVITFFGLVLIGLHLGFTTVFGVLQHPNSRWDVVTWKGSLGAFVLSSRTFFRYSLRE